MARGGYLCAMTDTAEIEERPATRRRPVGGVPVTIGCWVAVAGFAIWALVRVFGLESGFPFIQLISFTPYVAGAAVLVPLLVLVFRRWAAAMAAALVAATLVACVLARRRRQAARRPDGEGDGRQHA